MTLFESMILGHYKNKKQAQSNPSVWPQINILYTKVGANVLDLKQWYNYQGEDKPYRHYNLFLEYVDEYTVFTHAINKTDAKPACDLQWGYFDGWWYGEIKDECILRDTKVISNIQFNGTVYKSLDTGYNIETGKFAWGKQPEEGMFEFVRLNNARTLDYSLTDNVRNED